MKNNNLNFTKSQNPGQRSLPSLNFQMDSALCSPSPLYTSSYLSSSLHNSSFISTLQTPSWINCEIGKSMEQNVNPSFILEDWPTSNEENRSSFYQEEQWEESSDPSTGSDHQDSRISSSPSDERNEPQIEASPQMSNENINPPEPQYIEVPRFLIRIKQAKIKTKTTPKEENLEKKQRLSQRRRGKRRKIKMEFIEDKNKRHVAFSKRKASIIKKAYELSSLTGSEIMILIGSETGNIYSFATPHLQSLVTNPEGKGLISNCLRFQKIPRQLDKKETEIESSNIPETETSLSLNQTTSENQFNVSSEESNSSNPILNLSSLFPLSQISTTSFFSSDNNNSSVPSMQRNVINSIPSSNFSSLQPLKFFDSFDVLNDSK